MRHSAGPNVQGRDLLDKPATSANDGQPASRVPTTSPAFNYPKNYKNFIPSFICVRGKSQSIICKYVRKEREVVGAMLLRECGVESFATLDLVFQYVRR